MREGNAVDHVDFWGEARLWVLAKGREGWREGRSAVFGGYRGGVTFHGSKLVRKAFGAIKLRLDTSSPGNFSRHILPLVFSSSPSSGRGLISPYCDSWPVQTPQPPLTPTLFAVDVNTGDRARWTALSPFRVSKGCTAGRWKGGGERVRQTFTCFYCEETWPDRGRRGTVVDRDFIRGIAGSNIDNFGSRHMDAYFTGKIDLQGRWKRIWESRPSQVCIFWFAVPFCDCYSGGIRK